jgi:hypothetical protein
MSTIRIRKKIDSETLFLPELKLLLGQTVEITISGSSEAAFCAEAGHGPASERERLAQPSANQGMLNVIADVERIQQGMQPKDDKNSLPISGLRSRQCSM